MIDQEQIDSHPASQLAAQWLTNLKEPSTSTTPLMRLTLAYLRRVTPEAGPQNYLAELVERAQAMQSQPAADMAELFCPDWETLQADLKENQEHPWPTLAQHLNVLTLEMRKAKTLREVGSLLAENLFNSLCFLYPSFGPQRN